VNNDNQHGFQALSGAALATPAHQWLAALGDDPEDVISTVGTRVDDPAVDRLAQMTGLLGRLDEQLDRTSAIALIRQHARSIQTLLADHSYTNSVGRRLYSIEAELLRLCGRLTHESDQHALSQRYMVAALRAAHTAGDHALGANILSFMADFEFDQGHMRDAAKLAQTAREGYRGDLPELVARLAIQAALAEASAGEDRAARSALDAAFRQVDGFGSGRVPGWLHWVDEAIVHQFAGGSHLALRDYDGAAQHYDRALAPGS